MNLGNWLPAVAMMLGWGLRGFIGGGPFGAMIPGALVILTLAVLYPRRDWTMLAAFGAVGVGFGGEMTYGQTVGFITKAETFWWGFLGLGLKGAIWGALAGAVIGMGFTPRWRLVLGGGAVMTGATWVGWKLINEPRVIYFSNLLDRPREEIWAGFWLAAIALVAYLAWQGKGQPARRMAVAGFVGGFIGFGFGGAIQGVGRVFTPDLKLHWWKYMEFFFGFCFGWALAWATAHGALPAEESVGEEAPSVWVEMLTAAIVAGALFWLSWNLPIRFGYLVAGSAVLVLVARYRWLAKHVAYSVTFAAVTLDLVRFYRGAPEPAYALAVVASVGFGWMVMRWDGDARKMLELLMWACVGDALLKFALNPAGLMALVDHVAIGFVLMAATVSYWLRRLDRGCVPPGIAAAGGGSLPR